MSPFLDDAMIFDGEQLQAVDLTLPSAYVSVSGAQFLEFAESIVSRSCFDFALPENFKSAVLHRLLISDDLSSFRLTKLSRESASTFLREYVSVTADELKADPIVLSICDGKSLQTFLDDEDDFAMLAENVFNDLDTEGRGKVRKSEIENALVHMGPKMGVPPFSEFPILSDILKKHEAEGDKELGLSQFAQLLEPVVQELADALAKNKVVVAQNIKVVNGYKLRKVLADEKHLDDIVEKLLEIKYGQMDAKTDKEIVWSFLAENIKDLGLPPLGAYDSVFHDVQEKPSSAGSQNDFMVLLKEILEKFAEQLEASSAFYHI